RTARCWQPSSTRSRTPYSALVVKIIAPLILPWRSGSPGRAGQGSRPYRAQESFTRQGPIRKTSPDAAEPPPRGPRRIQRDGAARRADVRRGRRGLPPPDRAGARMGPRRRADPGQPLPRPAAPAGVPQPADEAAVRPARAAGRRAGPPAGRQPHRQRRTGPAGADRPSRLGTRQLRLGNPGDPDARRRTHVLPARGMDLLEGDPRPGPLLEVLPRGALRA